MAAFVLSDLGTVKLTCRVAAASYRAIAVRIARDVSKNGAPEEIRTPDPQIRSLGLCLIIPGYVELLARARWLLRHRFCGVQLIRT
jgi:hypothetical protein